MAQRTPRRKSPRGTIQENQTPSNEDLMQKAKQMYKNDPDFIKVIRLIIYELAGPQWTVVQEENLPLITIKTLTNASNKTMR